MTTLRAFRHPLLLSLLLWAGAGGAATVGELRDKLYAGEFGACDEIVFATRTVSADPHWYANFSYHCQGPERPAFGGAGRLCAYHLKTGRTRLLLDDPMGTVRDPCVSYDGRTILFSYRPANETVFHLYTIAADGTGLRRLTEGEYDDIEPAWLPDGDIVFVSSRCRRWVNCWTTQVATIYRMKADGTGIRMISANTEHDNTPWPLPDGRILYMRWEYQNRRQVTFHHLWTMNPDGTQHQIYQGNTYPGSVYIDAKPVPGSDEILLIDSPGHGRRDHGGFVSLLSVKGGTDDRANVRTICKGNFFDPWAFSKDLFMFSTGKGVTLTDREGHQLPLFRLPNELGGAPDSNVMLYEPRPLMPRPRERISVDRTDLSAKTGEFYLENVMVSRSLQGVKPGTIKKLLVQELLPKPVNFSGGMEPLTLGGSFSLSRILGTVPVEEDGSAYFRVPALKALFFVALDADGRAVKFMQSFTQVMPGERQGCVGCHEKRAENNVRRSKPVTKALARGPSEIDASDRAFDVADFPRDVQPVLDRSCVRCHNPGKRSGNIDLTGGRGPMYSISYVTLILRGQVLDGRNLAESDWPPYARWSGGSPLVEKMSGRHHGATVDAAGRRAVMQWLDSSAPYAGTYAALGCGFLGGSKGHAPHNPMGGREASRAAQPAFNRRCVQCHSVPRAVSAYGGNIRFHGKEDARNKRLAWVNGHICFNLTTPKDSLMLMAPLAKEAGGLGLCTNAVGKAVFASTEDSDYKLIRAMIEDGKAALEAETRFDMPNFRPNDEYVREMKRYGVLPKDFDATKNRIDPYALDRAYWNLDWTQLK
ncbi:MAG: hypothetical protein ACI4RA_04185 [Kiritimatiellia bacterium]